MSRLDSAIRRLAAQRACLAAAAEAIGSVEGPVLELGLGNGRTYDHLRSLLPGRIIYVFDRQIAAHPDCVPPEGLTFLGEFAETLPQAAERLGATAALIHADIGNGDSNATARNAAAIAPLLLPLLQPDGIVVADQPLRRAGLFAVPLPDKVWQGRYFMYRRKDQSFATPARAQSSSC